MQHCRALITLHFPHLPALSLGRAQPGSKGRSKAPAVVTAVTHSTDWRLTLKDNRHTAVGEEKEETSNQSSHAFTEESVCFGFLLLPFLLKCFFLGCIFHHIFVYSIIYFILLVFSVLRNSCCLKIFPQLSPAMSKLTHVEDLNCCFRASHIQHKSLKQT